MDMTSWLRAAHGSKEVWHVTAVVRSFDANLLAPHRFAVIPTVE
jgi:hypothetical protein